MRSFFKQSWALARKELDAYFGSAMALIFVGTFIVATLFSFFWAENFWVRNIADVRPLFRWMPILMIFLVAALTMRQWSEEQRSGTLEILLTLPVRKAYLVLAKFMAVMLLIAVALALTLFLPITVSLIGSLDWGPVIGGYLATLLMASAYVAIGLFVSSRTDNQIVSLIVTVIICGLFYLAGSAVFTDLVGDSVGGILRAIGTGSRFESIERGVIDLRDLIYYLSLSALFLFLNVFSLDVLRWSRGAHTRSYRLNAILSVSLIGANLLAANVWLFPVRGLRVDLTANHEYSLSSTTRDLVSNLQEPLLIQGYFSEKTHPLLAPLVPSVRDMLREYEIASVGRIEARIVDPRDDEELEAEANQVYGIRPTPFRVAGRYEESIINSYFDILIRYGDQSEVLSFQDLIEVESMPSGEVDVRLRNLEYDLTRTIKKVVYGFQSLDAVFAGIDSEIMLTVLVSSDTLPEPLFDVVSAIEAVGQELQSESPKFNYQFVDPDAPDSGFTRQSLYDTYGLQPIAVSLFSPESYYFYMLLQIGDETQVIYPASGMSQAEVSTEIESALRRSTPGFLKTVGVWSPSEDPVPNPYDGSAMQPVSTWQILRQFLQQNYTVKNVDLSSGYVPGDVDALVVVAPQGFTAKERFAVDQYLMRGGAVILAAANYMLSPQQLGTSLMLQQVSEGLNEMLDAYGVSIEESMVMDPQNEPFPVQVQRQVSGMSVVELQQVPYPFFVDVRQNGMTRDSPIVANLPAITLHWASPVEVDEAKNEGREVTTLIQSTDGAWLTSSTNSQPDLDTYPELGFPVEGEQASHALAVSIRGAFDSYFKEMPSPFETEPEPTTAQEETQAAAQRPLAKIESSPESSRLIVIGSAEFLDDTMLGLSQRSSQDRYLNNLQFLQNAVDWAVEDQDLLAIRSRGTYVRLLNPLSEEKRSFWEVLNYAVALIGLIVLGVVWNSWQRNEEPILGGQEEDKEE